jgi:uncharacterized protein YdaU (DUF1376 family)
VNFYEHHIGDYDKNTSHLTACEDGIYSRMIRRYMDKEKPLDTDVNEIKRLVRARSREEKTAVATVLKEFFFQLADGWHHKTCDEMIAAYQAGEPEREVKKANEDNRMKRHREERASLFKRITDAGQHAPWNIGIAELRAMVERLQNPDPETQTPPLPATAPATPATATQAPLPTTHYPELTSKAEDSGSTANDYDPPRVAPLPVREVPPLSDDPALQLAMALRRMGVDAKFTHPTVQEWTNGAVAIEILQAAVTIARERKPEPEKIQVNYLRPIVLDLLHPPAAAPASTRPTRESWEWKKTDQGCNTEGDKYGLRARGGESRDSFIARIEAEKTKRRPRP